MALLNFIAVAPLSYDRASRSVITDPPATVRFLQAHPGRVFSFLPDIYADEVLAATSGRPGEPFLQAATLFPNTNLFFGVLHAGYFDQIRSRAMSRFLNFLGDPYTGTSDLRELPTREEQVRVFESRKPLLDFLGIRYVISGYPLDPRQFPKVFETTVAPGVLPLAIYDNSRTRPLVSLAPSVTYVKGDIEAFRKFQASNFSGAFVTCAEECPAGAVSYGSGEIEILDLRNGELAFRISSPETLFLVVSQNHLPGWRAAIDGREVPIQTINTVYMGVRVPPGEHELEFQYGYPCPPRRLFSCLFSTTP